MLIWILRQLSYIKNSRPGVCNKKKSNMSLGKQTTFPLTNSLMFDHCLCLFHRALTKSHFTSRVRQQNSQRGNGRPDWFDQTLPSVNQTVRLINESGDNTFMALSFIKDAHHDAETLTHSSNLPNACKEMLLFICLNTILIMICQKDGVWQHDLAEKGKTRKKPCLCLLLAIKPW